MCLVCNHAGLFRSRGPSSRELSQWRDDSLIQSHFLINLFSKKIEVKIILKIFIFS
ncbi:MAG: hypothetical protein ACRC1M_05595 [Methanobacteriaceae archaeon]